jgi:hypothetical protein
MLHHKLFKLTAIVPLVLGIGFIQPMGVNAIDANSRNAAGNEFNFAPIRLSLGFSQQIATVSGFTESNFSLTQLARVDRNGKPCLGFAARTPDRKIVLEQSFKSLTFRASSERETSIAIGLPNGQFLCGYGSGNRRDAIVVAENLPPGEYPVWVGTIDPGRRTRYTLTVTE